MNTWTYRGQRVAFFDPPYAPERYGRLVDTTLKEFFILSDAPEKLFIVNKALCRFLTPEEEAWQSGGGATYKGGEPGENWMAPE